MVLQPPHELISALLDVLGLQNKKIIELTLHMKVNEIVTITTEEMVTDEMMKNITTVCKKYHLTAKEPEDGNTE